MSTERIMDLVIIFVYISSFIYYTWRTDKLRRQLVKETEDASNSYRKVFEDTMDILAERHYRFVRRTHFLNVCDWAYARKTHGDLKGLAFLLPQDVMETTDAVDVEKYFTDDEVEAIREGLAMFRKDKRTAALCDLFVLRH